MELNSSEVKDALWATWTSPYGWPVQGVWPPNPDGTEIKAVSRCRNWEAVEVIASVDNFGRVRLFHFPCIHIGAPDKCYRGHAGNILNVDFSYNDEYCITVGGDDKCIFVWKTDILEDLRERKQSKLLVARTKGKKKDGGLDASLREDGMMGSNQSNYLFYIDPDPSEQPEYQGLQQWRKSVRDPTTWTDPPHFERPVEEILELQFVHGYRGWDCRNNIGYADVVDEIVYHTAGVGIVYDVKEDRQVHNTEHTGEIVCLAMHPAGHTVATGQYLGEGPKLVLWDANTGVTVRVIDFHRRGVSQVAFSGSGSLLISIGMDVDKTVAVHNVETGALVGDAKAGMLADIFALAVGGDKKFVTGGKNHCKFWDLPRFSHPGGELSSKAGIFNKNVIDSTPTVVSVVFIDADVITGMSDGSLGLWKGRTNTRMETGHTGAVTAMCALPSTSTTAIKGSQGAEVATGGEDGLVIIWNDQLVKLWSLDLKLSSPTSMKPMVQALAAKEGRVLIGTKASEIYEVDLINLNQEILMKYVQGHYEETAKISGLACHPSKKQYVTIGGDLSVRLWCARDRQQVNILTLGAEALAVEYTPDGTQVLVGTDDGRLHVLTESLSNVIASYTVASGLIDVIAVSPDGHSIAIGTRDRSIYILDGKNFSVRAQCEGHSFYVTAIDFSSDGKYIQSTNGRLDLLFFDAYSGDYITTPSSMRDVTWATQTCTLGWSTQGLHAPPNTDISKSVNVNINCVDRSPQGNILASGDDSRGMRICRFPALLNHGLQPPQKVYRAHSHPVSKVRFGFDGNFVISVGGADKTIVQWEVKRPKKSSTFIGR
jgi:microtubule-associated protein-like 6